MATDKTVIDIAMTSDFICPWCRIGEKRLENALAMLSDDIKVKLRWQPFELNPHMRKEGMDRKVYRSMKFGSWERSQSLDAETRSGVRGVPQFDIEGTIVSGAKPTDVLAQLIRSAAHQKSAGQCAAG